MTDHPIINLMSDTVTKPTSAMREAMMNAEVGDDVFGEDPTVNALESKAAKMFGKEAAVFCPSGTMTNQIAINLHTQKLDEVICDHFSHIYLYETGGYAANSGVAINLIEGRYGKITADQVEAAVKSEFDWLPHSALVVLENTANKGGGSIYRLKELKPIRKICQKYEMKLHLDGARLFNGLVETKESTKDYGSLFDTISICLSKGLGAPVGSLLIGSRQEILKARRFRKVMGGGMRQAGFLAAAGIYALDHHVERLTIDNQHAKILGEVLEEMPYVTEVKPVESNILIFDIDQKRSVPEFLKLLDAQGIKAVQFGPNSIRFVTHMEVNEMMIARTIDTLKKLG
ncbi:MAG: aminotransferase class I/II-fold pyridoxal phosphate-dependent enzyme [Bacteroidia bacterium]|nr:aminotransferase class I/II-fold pyridoxal phosphate-dependent enzyme [Bacteroidia bacterium]